MQDCEKALQVACETYRKAVEHCRVVGIPLSSRDDQKHIKSPEQRRAYDALLQAREAHSKAVHTYQLTLGTVPGHYLPADTIGGLHLAPSDDRLTPGYFLMMMVVSIILIVAVLWLFNEGLLPGTAPYSLRTSATASSS